MDTKDIIQIRASALQALCAALEAQHGEGNIGTPEQAVEFVKVWTEAVSSLAAAPIWPMG